jgi:hypothetical protein
MAQFQPIPSIIILEQPSEYAFPGEWLEIALALEKSGVITAETFALQTSVHFHDGLVPMGQTDDLSFAKLVSNNLNIAVNNLLSISLNLCLKK